VFEVHGLCIVYLSMSDSTLSYKFQKGNNCETVWRMRLQFSRRREDLSLLGHHHHHHRLYNSVSVLVSLKSLLQPRLLLSYVTMIIFPVWGSQPHAQPPTLRTRVPLLVWVITFDLFGKGAPDSSYATTGIALRIILPHKPHHYVKVGIPSVELLGCRAV
jgi:hypothetical protein